LGEYISSGIFELEISIKLEDIPLISIGDVVSVHSEATSKTHQGKVVRINNKIDPNTQMVSVFVDLKGDHLHDGMFLDAEISGENINNVFEIPRKALLDNDMVYYVKESELMSITVNPVRYNKSTVLVSNLPDNLSIISQIVPGAFLGMKVKAIEQN
ncbi:MAG: HlyD family efflux transporter periplasmic adaptor subunit, partial [Bacteroidales bacterium]|nr:HlyD family efflux transporter periplasmic adaptor subunit [Bacteroidales bacterium]